MFELLADPRGPLKIWRPPAEGRSYVVGADTGGGKASQDWCAAAVLDAATKDQVASFRAHMEAADFGYALWLLCRYYRDAFVVPEVNNHGLVVVNALRELGYPHIYARQTWDNIGQRIVSTIGFVTSPKSRPMLISRARKALADGQIAVLDPQIFEEMSTFIIGETGREDHLDGCNDDALFAWMLALEGCEASFGTASGPAPVQESGRDAWVWDKVRAMQEQKGIETWNY